MYDKEQNVLYKKQKMVVNLVLIQLSIFSTVLHWSVCLFLTDCFLFVVVNLGIF